MNTQMYGSPVPFAAHEVIGMNEALMSKAAKAELLSTWSRSVQDVTLRDILTRQAQALIQHYSRGLEILQGQPRTQPTIGYQAQIQQIPQIGTRQLPIQAPNLNTQYPSDRSIVTAALDLHKFGALSWLQMALECVNPELRSTLIEGVLMCDQMAYELFSYMNTKGYYQVVPMRIEDLQPIVSSHVSGLQPQTMYSQPVYMM